jgi:V-type H+-transporting ATPase proteolipid subunit
MTRRVQILLLTLSVAVGITGNAAVTADAANPDIFIKVLVVEVFASVLGIFGLILGILGFTAAKKADAPS